MTWRLLALVSLLGGLILLGPTAYHASAQEEATAEAAPETAEAEAPAEETPAPTPGDETAFAVDNFFLLVAAILVLFMQAGFAMVEAGFNPSKHAVNILFKNTIDMAIGALIYFLIGYHLMYPVNPISENYIGEISPGINGGLFESGTPTIATSGATAGKLTDQVNFLFQVAFAATAATIVSGAVAGRLKFGAYLVYSVVITAFVYPMIGYWKWGYGWLDDMGFYDFAGSGVVHMTGGFAGLAGAMLLGPRIGRYNAAGKPVAIPGHSLPLATLGVFILLIGWYGFNPGSQLKVVGTANTDAVMLIAVNTTFAACAGCVMAMLASWAMFSKPDLGMALNGLLGGLVGITANCNGVTNFEAIIIGAVAGIVVVAASVLLDKLKIDDAVGAFPVHGACGMWGLIACSLFGDWAYWGNGAGGAPYGNWTAQIVGLAAIAGFAFVTMLILFSALKAIGMLRVPPEEEEQGLDVSHHGMAAYGG